MVKQHVHSSVELQTSHQQVTVDRMKISNSARVTRFLHRVSFRGVSGRWVGVSSSAGPSRRWRRRRFRAERDVRIYQTADDTDVKACKVDPTEDVIAADDHAEIRYEQILEHADNGGSESRVVVCADNDRVHEEEAHQTGHKEID
jgi:hypothetical protein